MTLVKGRERERKREREREREGGEDARIVTGEFAVKSAFTCVTRFQLLFSIYSAIVKRRNIIALYIHGVAYPQCAFAIRHLSFN
jgi:hypothetical protein